jgi:hypothetical protein
VPALAAPAVQATRRRGILSDRWGLDIFPISGAVGPDGDIAQPATPFENERESPSQQALPSQPSDVNGLAGRCGPPAKPSSCGEAAIRLYTTTEAIENMMPVALSSAILTTAYDSRVR